MRSIMKELAGIAVALLWMGTATAKAEWYTANVTMTGAGFGTVYVQFTDQSGAFSNKWCWGGAEVGQCNRLLATALAAVQMNKPVLVNISASLDYPPISAMYLKP